MDKIGLFSKNIDDEFEIINNNLVVILNEDLDHHNAEIIREKIDRLIELERIKNIIFDFSKVTFMDSSGIGVIMGRYRKVYYNKGKIIVVGLSRIIDKIFSMSGLYNIVTKYMTLNEALNIK